MKTSLNYKREFDSPMEFFSFAKKAALNQRFKSFLSHIEKAIDLMNSNSSELEDKFTEYRKESGVFFQKEEYTQQCFSYSGDYVDVDRFLNGEPECMVCYEGEIEKSVKYQDIEIRYARPWILSEETDKKVFHYYANILSIIDEIESNGTRCRVSIVADYESKSKRGILKAKIKDYDEVLDLRLLCNTLFCEGMSAAARCASIKMIGTDDCWGTDADWILPTFEDREGEMSLCFPSTWAVEKNRFGVDMMTFTKDDVVRVLGIETK